MKYNFFITIFFIALIFFQSLISEHNNLYLSANIKNGFYMPVNMWNINSKEDDFAPYFMEQNSLLIFNSIVDGYSKYWTSVIQNNNITDYADTNITIKIPIILNSALNQKRKNNAYFCLLDNKQALVNSHTMFPNGNFVNIKKSNFERNTWTEPNIIIEFNDTNFIGHPTISPSKNTLIFSSTKNSPNNTTDLWSATLQQDGIWDMLVPIDELNSIGNEITPYFINDTTLIFASDGFDGKGGYDLYYAYYLDGTWTKPFPLEDINTEYNETDPTIMFDYLVFASDRPGGKGKLDLYYAKIKSNDTTENIINPLIIFATNYQININRNIEYDLISKSAKKTFNTKEDTTYILNPNIIEFNIHNDNTNNNFNYMLFYGENNLLEQDNIFNDSSVIIDFRKYVTELFLVDTCYIKFMNQNAENITPMEIIKNESKSPKIYSQKNDTFHKIFATNAENIKSFEELNQDIIPQLKELSLFSKRIEIIANSSKIYNDLKKMFNQNNITFIKTDNNDIIEFRVYR